MKTPAALIVALACLPSLAHAEAWPCLASDNDPALQVEVQRPAGSLLSFLGNPIFTNPNLSEFEDLPPDHAHAIHLAEAMSPAPSDVRNLVLLAAGQQGANADISVAFSNIMTGQSSGYRSLNYAIDQTADTTVNRCGVYGRLVAAAQGDQLDGFSTDPEDDTWVGLVFDAAFYYSDSDLLRDDKVDAWFDYLTGQVSSPAQVDHVVLGGVSRGGALQHHLAERLSDDPAWDHVKLVLLGVDVVTDRQSDEHCSTSDDLDNPTLAAPQYYAWAADLDVCLPEREGLRVLQLVGGDQVAVGEDRHAFAVTTPDRRERLGFHQRWVPWEHAYWLNDLDRDGFVEDMVDPVLHFLSAALQEDSDDRWRIAFSGSDGLSNFSVVASEQGAERVEDLMLGDFDGDGDTDLLRVDAAGDLEFAQSMRGSSWGAWEAFTAGPSGDASADELRVGDFDGDGTDDLLHLTGASGLQVRLSPPAEYISQFNSGAGLQTLGAGLLAPLTDSAPFPTDDSYALPDLLFEIPAPPSDDGPGWQAAGGPTADLEDLLVGDFDGDGADDILHLTGSTWQLYTFDIGSSEMVDAGALATTVSTSWASEGERGPAGWLAAEVLVGDFDGDGRAELAHGERTETWPGLPEEAPAEGTMQIEVCEAADSGDSTNCTTTSHDDLFVPRYGDLRWNDRIAVGDANGDGADDLLVLDDQHIRVKYSDGVGSWDEDEELLPRGPHSWREFASNYGFGDFDRDGRIDVLFIR